MSGTELQGVSLSSFRDQGAAILNIAAAQKGQQSEKGQHAKGQHAETAAVLHSDAQSSQSQSAQSGTTVSAAIPKVKASIQQQGFTLDSFLSQCDRNVLPFTFLNHPSTQAMRLRAAATQLFEESLLTAATQGPHATQPSFQLLMVPLPPHPCLETHPRLRNDEMHLALVQWRSTLLLGRRRDDDASLKVILREPHTNHLPLLPARGRTLSGV